MLRHTLRSWAKLLLIAVIVLPFSASAKSSAAKEPIDLSILQQVDTLLPYMTVVQKIDYLDLIRTIEAAEADLRTGQNLASTKPSKLYPDRDVKPIIKRGEQLIERSQQTVETSQIELVVLLTQVEAQKDEQVASEEKKFDYTLESAAYEDALAAHCQLLLETCWELGYDSLFFDGVFILDSEGTRKADPDVRNQVYDTLVKIDGNTFSVTTPVGLQLKADTHGQGSQIFSYENASIFKDDKKALLAIELIAPKGSSAGLLSLRAIDLDTQTIAAHQLVKVTNLAEVLGPESDASGLEAKELLDSIPEQIKLRNQANTLEILANLAHPYTYEVAEDSDSKVAASLLTYTLLQNSDLLLADSDFILRAYGESLEMADTWVGQANARLTLATSDVADSYQLSAQANGSERVLPGGTLILSYNDKAPEALAEAE